MKKLYLLPILLLFFAGNIFSQSVGDYGSASSNDWSDFANTWVVCVTNGTWAGATGATAAPTNSTNVFIRTGHTVTIDADAECNNLTVTETLLGTANTLSVYGNLTNNGILDLWNTSGTALVFTGTGDATFSGTGATTDIFTIEINKDLLASTVQLSTSNFSVQATTASAPKFLTLTTGTFRLSGSFTMSSETFIGGAAYTFDADDGFWLDNSNFTIQGQDGQMEFNGLCRISAGTFNVGNTAMQRFYLNNNDVEFIMSGGTLNLTGAFYADDDATINIAGGTINVASEQVTTNNWYCFRVTDATASFTMSGGIINLINTNQGDREYQVNTSEANTNITGGTLNIGTSATAGDFNFEINGRMPNLVIDNTTNVKTAIVRGETWIYDDLRVNGIFQYRPDAGATMHVYGDLTVSAETAPSTDGIFRTNPNCTANRTHNLNLYGNLIVNGHFDGFIDNGGNEGRIYTIFRGTTNTTVTGTGATCDFYDIEVNKSSGMATIVDIQRVFTMPVPTGGANGLSATSGTLKLSGTSTINITPYYNNQNITEAAGKFWMTNPNLTINWANAGQATSNGEFVMDNGAFTAGTNFVIQGSSTANNQINGGTLTVTGYIDMEQDVLISGGTVTCTGDFRMDGDNANETGDLTVTGGTLNVGDGNNFFRAYGGTGDDGEGGSLTMSNGTINVYGGVEFQNGTGTEVTSFTMTGGNFNIDPQHTTNIANNVDLFLLNDNTVVNFTGGTLTFIDPHADKSHVYRDAIDIRGQTGTKNFIGSTIQFGDGTSNDAGDETYPGYSIYVANNFDLQFGDIILNNSAGANREFICRNNTNIFCNNLTITNANDKYVMNGRILDVSGNLINNGEIDGTTDTYADNHLRFTGTAAQTYSGTGSLTSAMANITINNTSATGVTLESDLGGEWVSLTDGHVYTSSTNYLTVYGTATTDLDGGSTASYVQGNLRRAIPNNASSADYNFPVGKANYRLIEMQGITTSGTGNGFITANVFEGVDMNGKTASSGLANPTVAENIYWQISPAMASVSLDAVSSVRLTYTDPPVTPPRTIGQSNNNIDGTYTAIGRGVGAGTLQSESFNLTGINPTGDAYIIISEVEPLEGTYYIGTFDGGINPDASRFYQSLTAVAAELRVKYVNDNVRFEILSTYDDDNETIPINFDKLMLTDPAHSVSIYPRTGVTGVETVQTGTSNAMITIDNIHDLIFDGRPNLAGTTSEWTFANINATPGPVFEFKNDANTNTLTYLSIQSDVASTTNGVINFGTTTETNGNDDNTISYCDITGRSSTPTIGIYSAGSAGLANSGNTIDNCNIYDFFNATTNTAGIHLANDNDNWTISNNKMYQTGVRVFSTGSIYSGIWAESGTNHTINSNTIGFASSSTTGVTNISGSTGEFCAIYMNVENGTASNITNNLISGITFSTSNTTVGNGLFNGIYVDAGDVNIGTSGNGNTIGTSGNFASYPIQITTGANAGAIRPIYIDAPRPVTVTDNNIGGMQIAGNYQQYFRGIQTANTNGNSDYIIRGNTVGSSTQANSIHFTGSDANWEYTVGIFAYQSDDIIIDDNIIANITSTSTSNDGSNRIIGIYTDNTDVNTITDNQIYKLTNSSGNQGATYNAALVGIVKRSQDAADQTISGNTIHSLKNLDAGNRDVRVIGIYLRSGASANDDVSANFIHSFNSESEDAVHYGIYLENGGNTLANNMIQLGIDETGNSITEPITLYGIANLSDDPCNFYHNSIYIGGTGVTDGADGAGKNSYVFYQTEDAIVNIKNNIFNNVRSTTGAVFSKHYAMSLTYKDNVSSDYNIFNASGTGGVVSILDDNPQATLQAHRYYFSNMDLYSGYGTPNFVAPTGTSTTCNLHIQGNTSAFDMCKVIATITTDYDGTSRGGEGDATCIGADDGAYAITNAEDIFTPNFSYIPITNKTPIQDAIIDVTITDQAPSGEGVDQTNEPRIYYRRADSDTPANIDAWADGGNNAGVRQSGNGESGVWRFTIQPSDFSPALANNDVIEYFIIAQDKSTIAANPNVWYSKFGATTPDFDDVSTNNLWPDGTVDVDFYGIGGTMNGTYTIGTDPTDDFPSLTGSKGFFQNISALNHTGDIVAVIQEDITEPATYACGQWVEVPSNSGYYVTVSTGGAYKLNCSANKDMIRFEGADRVIFDGNIGGTGKNLTIEQTNINYSTFTFTDDAKNNVIKNCNIYGSPRLKPIGIVHFGETTGTDGNDDNTVQNNLIWNVSGSQPDNAVYSRGNVDNVVTNSGNTISGNDIKNCNSTGIWVTPIGNGDGWTISNNTMYYNYATLSTEEQSGIRVEQGEGHTVTGNKIGGDSPTLPTSAWENTGQNDFYGIYMSVGSGTLSTVSGNTIHNIHKSNTANNTNEFRGIYIANNGKVNIDNNNIYNIINDGNDYTYCIYADGTPPESVSGNQIYNITSNTGNDDFRGIWLDYDNINTDLVSVNDNTIKGITENRTNGNTEFYGINLQDGNFEIKRNTIGGDNAQDKITFNGGGFFRGIYLNDNSSTGDFTDNSIYNIEITNGTYFNGFYISNVEENFAQEITNNTIDNLTLNVSVEANCFRINDGYPNMYNNTIGTATYGITQNGAGTLNGIHLFTNNTGTVIHSNSIGYLNSVNDFNGIYVNLEDNNADTYELNNNTISNITSANDVTFCGINIINGNAFSIDGNKVEAITMSGSASEFKGIWVSGGISATIGTSTANTIGHVSTANSIQSAGISLIGISLTGSSQATVSNNIVANLQHTNTANTSFIIGYEIDGNGTKTISSNIVRDITTSSTKTDITDGILASQGVWVGGSSTSSIASNTIYNITASGTANTNVAAISENATNATITKNKIYNISNTTSGSGTASGIVLYNLNAGYVANNMIAIGEADATEYSGIWIPQANANTKNVYFNSINILDGPTGNSYAFLREDNTTPLNVKNNIFSNFASAGSRYAVASRNTTGLTNASINSNCYYSANSATTGLWGAVDNDFDTWIANTGEDTDYLSTDKQPLFVDAANCNLHLSNYNNACSFNSVGELIASVTDDWDGDARDANHPDIGADEFTPTAHTGDYVWRGWTDTDWATATNWQCGFAPASSLTEKIVVPESINDAIVGTDFTTAALDVKNNGIITVSTGNLLTVGGIFTNDAGGEVVVDAGAFLTSENNFVNNGILTLRSPSNGGQSGSFIDEVDITGTGVMHAERFFTQKAYHYFSVPVQDVGGNANSSLFCTSATGNFNANLLSYNEAADLVSPPPVFDEQELVAGWVYLRPYSTSPNVELHAKVGYAFYDESSKLVTFEGVPNTGDQSYSGLAFTNNDTENAQYDGWHLIANPYPSSIDWEQIYGTLSNIDNAISVWEGDYLNGEYKEYVGGTGGTLGQYIAPMQSFFVHANNAATPGSFTLDINDRSHSTTIYRSSDIVLNNSIKLDVNKGGLSSQALIYFKKDATSEFDGKYDAVKFIGAYSQRAQFYSISSEQTKLAINSLPNSEIENTSVPLGMFSANGGESTISLSSFIGFNNIHIYLEDKTLNKTINLRVQTDYSFNLDPSYVSDRFVLHFNKNNAPVLTNPFDKQFAEEDTNFEWTFVENVFIDPDLNDNVTYSVSLANGGNLPNWLNFDNASRTFTGIPKNADVDIIDLHLIATDMFGEKSIFDFQIEVKNVNDAPTVQNLIEDQFILTGEKYSFKVPENIFFDIDKNDNLILSASLNDGGSIPSWLIFDDETNNFYGYANNPEDYNIKLTATDKAGAFVSTTFKLSVGLNTNINDFEYEISSVYPNPSDGKFYIASDIFNNNKIYDIKIKDIRGNTVYFGKIDSNNNYIDINYVSSGMYFIEIDVNNKKYVKSIIIED